MPVERFPDTDILLCGYDLDAPAKRRIAQSIIEEAWHQPGRMVNNSWSNALGREASTGGKIDPSKNLDMGPVSSGMRFGSEHEAGFKWQCAKTWKFYELLWNALYFTQKSRNGIN